MAFFLFYPKKFSSKIPVIATGNLEKENKYHKDLPVLQNDTNNIIVYKDGLELSLIHI